MIKATRYFIVFLLFTVFNLLFTIPAYAQEKDLHNYTQRVMIEVTSSLTCILAGIDPINPSQKCLGINNGKIGPVDTSGGAIGAMGNLIAMTFTPPAHTGDYIKYLAGNFGLTKPAYAQNQGIGFTGLSPLTNVWVAFRNIVYLLFVLVFVVIGFAIMLRVRIDPRTVMTIENQIPKIIIGLILVTFSFAIAGFLIDFMWVLIYLVANVFVSIDPAINTQITQSTNPLEAGNYLPKQGELGGFARIASDASGSVAPFFAPIFDNPPGRIMMAGILTLLAKFGLAEMVTSVITSAAAAISVATGGVGIVPTAIGGIAIGTIVNTIAPVLAGTAGLAFAPQIAQGLGFLLAFIIILIAIIWALIRLWFALLKAYVMILVVVVFSPFWILAGLIPGSRLTFENLLRELGSNLIAFPATIVMFLLARTFMDLFGKAQGEIFVPPLIGNPAGTAVGSLVGLGIILLTPDVVKMMRKALQAPEFDFSAIAQAIGVGAGATNPIGLLSRGGQFGMTMYYAQQTPVLGGLLQRMGIGRPRQ